MLTIVVFLIFSQASLVEPQKLNEILLLKSEHDAPSSICDREICAGAYTFRWKWLLQQKLMDFKKEELGKNVVYFPGLENADLELKILNDQDNLMPFGPASPYYAKITPDCPSKVQLKHALIFGTDTIYSLTEDTKRYGLPVQRIYATDFQLKSDKIFDASTKSVYLYMTFSLYLDVACTNSNCKLTLNCKDVISRETQPDYYYSGLIPQLDVDIAKEIVGKYDLKYPEITKLGVEYLKKNLTPDNVVEVLTLARSRRIEDLTDRCIEYLNKRKVTW